jgi:hypothetical protein
VWDGAAIAVGGSPIGGGVQTTFCLHIDHPELNAPTTAITANAANLQLPLLLNQIDPTTGYALAPEAVTAFRHAKEFNLVSANGSYTPQLGYYQGFLQNVNVPPTSLAAPPVSVPVPLTFTLPIYELVYSTSGTEFSG